MTTTNKAGKCHRCGAMIAAGSRFAWEVVTRHASGAGRARESYRPRCYLWCERDRQRMIDNIERSMADLRESGDYRAYYHEHRLAQVDEAYPPKPEADA